MMTEAELEEAIATRCKQLGLLRLHLPPHVVRMLPPEWRGFPDDLIIGRYVLFAENKSPDGRRTKEQIAMQQAILRSANGIYSLWRPCDLEDGTIESVLLSLT